MGLFLWIYKEIGKMKQNKIFPWLVAFSALSISFSAAFYSIFGIGKMFAGASTNVMIMAGSLEFAKLVIASFLYRFWDDVNRVLRTYLMISCLVLILITSAGIYGFLSSAYQETANKVENVDKNVKILEKKKAMIQRQLDQAEKQLDYKNQRQNTLSDMRNRQQINADNLIAQNRSASSVRGQMNNLGKESTQIDSDIKTIQDTITSKNKQISDLDLEILNVSSNNDLANEIGPLKYIAKLTGKTLDQVVNWFIIALMLVFDPLAISLVIAANFVFSQMNNKKEDTESIDPVSIDSEETEEEIQEIEELEEIHHITEDEKEPETVVNEHLTIESAIEEILESQDSNGNENKSENNEGDFGGYKLSRPPHISKHAPIPKDAEIIPEPPSSPTRLR
jgi:hypothetical protein